MRVHVWLALLACVAFASLAPRPVESATLTTLYQFLNASGGTEPLALLAGKDDSLLGLTLSGGDFTNCTGGCGAAFSLTPSGKSYQENVIYAWPYGPVDPDSLLLAADGTLFGATYQGAIGINGSVFKLVPNSKKGYTQSTIYQFGGFDGSGPGDLLQDRNGALIGTLESYAHGNTLGANFKLTPGRSGYTLSFLYEFTQRSVGAAPSALTAAGGGVYYGSTALGGVSDAGIIYELTPARKGYVEKTLLNFNGSNGAGPASKLLVDRNGDIFGTASGGHCLGRTCGETTGVAFELSPSKNGYLETLLHVFAIDHDAHGPTSELVLFHGALYGTTGSGAAPYQYGTIYKLTKEGKGYRETILYAFHGSDGSFPDGLIAGKDDALYGYTASGGASNNGTVFKFVP